MKQETLQLKEVHNGFSERDIRSKAILNNDIDSLLKYKIQQNKMSNASNSFQDLKMIKIEFDNMKTEMAEIKRMLETIVRG